MKKKQLKIIVLTLVLIAIMIGFFLGKDRLTFENIKQAQDQFQQNYHENQFLFIVIYTLIYILSVALSVPGAALLTLLAGAIFGFTTGTLLVSFASSLGATCCFLVSRYLLRDWVEARFGEKLIAVNKGLEQEGAFYLFTLRLIPAFPFFAINVVMGLTRINTWTFYWVSQVGMLAGTLVFVNAGTQLAQIESPRGLLSWKLWIAFILIGLFPIAVKTIMKLIRKNKSTQNNNKPLQST